MKTILAWHWSNGMKCRYDSRPIVPGETLVYEGKKPIELCERGLHASTKILDALYYAPGTTISRVRLSGDIIRGTDKIVSTRRETIWSFDATDTLIRWAADCAERALLREQEAGRIRPCFTALVMESAGAFIENPAAWRAEAPGRQNLLHSETYGYAAESAHNVMLAVQAASRTLRSIRGQGGTVAWRAWCTASYAGYAAQSAGISGQKERQWQSARLRNLIAEGRTKC